MSSTSCTINGENSESGNVLFMTPQKGLTPLAAFIEEELDRLQWSQLQLEEASGIPDSTIGRIRGGQEAKPSQIARLAKAFGRRFWYVVQRAGYTTDDPDNPSEEAQRLGAIFADDPVLSTLHADLLRLSPANRRAVMQMIRALLGEQPDSPVLPTTE